MRDLDRHENRWLEALCNMSFVKATDPDKNRKWEKYRLRRLPGDVFTASALAIEALLAAPTIGAPPTGKRLYGGGTSGADVADPDFHRKFMEMAVTAARKCEPEDGRVHPKVGVVVVRDGVVLATAYRGELGAGDHAEFTALEKKLPDAVVAGATVYTTLEPCTSRNHPKLPCASRLIERRVKRVVIGMHDPNPTVYGGGWAKLQEAGIATADFESDLKEEIKEMNRDFIRSQTEAGRKQGAKEGEG
jgi:pyrimidine deaminase RibD-like protein